MSNDLKFEVSEDLDDLQRRLKTLRNSAERQGENGLENVLVGRRVLADAVKAVDRLIALENTLAHRKRDKLVRESLEDERDRLATQRDNLAQELNGAEKARETMRQHRDAILKNHDKLAVRQDQLVRERDRLMAERDKITQERDTILQDRNEVVAQRDELVTQRDRLIRERDAVLKERDSWREDYYNLQQQRRFANSAAQPTHFAGRKTTDALVDVVRERASQRFSEAEDDRKTLGDWTVILTDYIGGFAREAFLGKVDAARAALVRVAALTLAAVESIDRKKQKHNQCQNFPIVESAPLEVSNNE